MTNPKLKGTMKGLFAPRIFTLPMVDKAMCEFLGDAILNFFQEDSAMATLAFVSSSDFHPYYTNLSDKDLIIFYKWFAWNKDKVKLAKEAADIIKENGKYVDAGYATDATSKKFCFSGTSGDDKCGLVAEFLFKLNNELENNRGYNINKVPDISLDINKNAIRCPGPTYLSLKGNQRYVWILKNSTEMKNYEKSVEQLKPNANMFAWSIYVPICIQQHLIGLFAIDGFSDIESKSYQDSILNTFLKMRPDDGEATRGIVKRTLDIDKLKSFFATLNMLETTLETLYRAYYSHVDDLSKEALDKLRENNKMYSWNFDCRVLSPAFMQELGSLVLTNERRHYNLTRACTDSIKEVLIVYYDANNFKKINDLLGHKYGNEVIRAWGRWIFDCHFNWVKKYAYAWLVRWGGDEYVAIFALTRDFSQRKWKVHLEGNKNADGLDNYLSCNNKEKLNNFIAGIQEISDQLTREKEKIEVTNRKIEDNLSAISISGGWVKGKIRSRDDFETLLRKSEITMYVAKEVLKSLMPNKYGSVCLEYSKGGRRATNISISEFKDYISNIGKNTPMYKRIENEE